MRFPISVLLLISGPVACARPTADPASNEGSTGGTDDGASDDEPNATTDAATSDAGVDDTGTDTEGDDGELAPFGDGERLHAIVEVDDDGDEVFAGWWDTELDAKCWMQATVDGDRRCLPGTFMAIGFADPGCTQPVARTTCDPPDWVLSTVVSDDVCDASAGVEVFEVGAPSDVVYWRGADGSCTALEGETGHHLTSIALDGFVSATHELVDGGPVTRGIMEGEDGSFQWTGPYDVQRGTSCSVRELEGESVCTPYGAAVDYDIHEDAACGGPGVAYDMRDASCAAPELASFGDTLARVTGPLDPASLYQAHQDTCEPLVPGSTARYWATEPVGPEAFPAAPEVAEGQGRLRRRFVTGADGEIVSGVYPPWRDTSLDLACTSYAGADGRDVCAPTEHFQVESFFGDAACSVPVVIAAVATDGWYTMLGSGAVCDGLEVMRLGRLGSLYEGSLYQVREGVCEALPGSLSTPTWTLTDVVPVEDLATLEIIAPR